MKRSEMIKIVANKLCGRMRPSNIEEEINEVLIELELAGMVPPLRTINRLGTGFNNESVDIELDEHSWELE